MAIKSIDGYHDNKHSRDYAYDDDLNKVDLEYDQRYFGLEIEMEFDDNDIFGGSRTQECYECGGSGSWEGEDGDEHECGYCDGSGEQESSEAGECTFNFRTGYQDTFYFEQDGSLNNGFEMITEPMTYNGALKLLGDTEVSRFIGLSTPRSSSGVHIHVSRTNHYDESVDIKLKTLMFRLQDRLEALTRSSSYAKWYGVPKEDGINSDPTARFLRVLHEYVERDDTGAHDTGYHNHFRNRHACVNFTNHHTLEFRFFNSTNDTDRIKQYVGLVNDIMDCVFNMTFNRIALGELVWDDTNPFKFTINKVDTELVVKKVVNSATGVLQGKFSLEHYAVRAMLRQLDEPIERGSQVIVDQDLLREDLEGAHIGYGARPRLTDLAGVGVSPTMLEPICAIGTVTSVNKRRIDSGVITPVYRVEFDDGSYYTYNRGWLDELSVAYQDELVDLYVLREEV